MTTWNNNNRDNYYDNERGDGGNEDKMRMKTQCHSILIQNLPSDLTKQEIEVMFSQIEIIKNEKKINGYTQNGDS